ncbi:hypothetical protein HN51_049255 [Arachis hypogaea]|uniref:BRO1 domain-containing protein n=1 Tax=Arachis hypogaea TaxID=3818 RepID=A0A444YFK5_ARAHY|nr:uncharacterized protein LOC107606426 [Arachis ipaensis]XP_025666622.1 uncharacterized protein LOC112764979 [Arachis hypogaea]QHN90943.1 uncharacterized protein DS421_17g570740 [Arachis hypogaea]RYR00712.1 hypothetical protein Ahy_B07g088840 [Arachis hypogaea]
MSNVNQNPERLLAIPVKKSDPVDLYRPLRKFVATKYSESDAQKVESVIETLDKCRRDMVERGDLSLPMQRDCLIHYFKCLCMVEPLFTAISSDADADPITFVWYDAFFSEHENGVSSQRNSIQLEKAAVIFNLGAICSQIGASCDRTTSLGRHLAMDAFNAAANFFYKLWTVFAKDVSATLDLSLLLAKTLHRLCSAQASELNLQQRLHHNNTNDDASSVSFESVSQNYRAVSVMILRNLPATEHILAFDRTWITHLSQKLTFFQVEALQRKSSILPESQQPLVISLVSPLDDDAESVTEKLVSAACNYNCGDPWTRELEHQPRIPFIDLFLSEYSPFKIMDGGKLVAYPWDMPPPYPTNLAFLSSSSSSHILAFPLKKCEPLDLYDSLRNYFVLKYSESVAKKVEGLLQMLNKLRGEMQRDDIPLPVRRDCLIRYFKCLCMIQPLFPMTSSPNPPIFVWYNAFNPQEVSSQHNIYLEMASVLFNLGALCTHIALSSDTTTNQGHRIAIDALNDASYWFLLLNSVTMSASATVDLSKNCSDMLREIISAEIADLNCLPHSRYDRSSFPGYPVSSLYRKAYDLLTVGTLAENLVQSSIPQYLESKINSHHVNTAPTDVSEEFLLRYCKDKSLLPEECQPPCLDLLSEAGPVMIKDGNLVANLRGSDVAMEEMSLPETTVTLP